MPSASDYATGFDAVADQLRSSAQVHAYALARHRGTAAESEFDARLEHTLDRLAVLYGHGTYEELSTEAIVETAIDFELRLAHELDGTEVAEQARARAQGLVNAARRGFRLRVRGLHAPVILRGVYVRPFRPEVAGMLHGSHEPYLRWRDGIVAVLPEATIAELRADGDRVDVLFLDPDELLDLVDRAARDDGAALEAELGRRAAVAAATPEQLGDSRTRRVRRLLLRQTTVLRNLRDRLAAEHPVAHAALLPVLDSHHQALRSALGAAPLPRDAVADVVGASARYAAAVERSVANAASDPDLPGFGAMYRAAAGRSRRPGA